MENKNVRSLAVATALAFAVMFLYDYAGRAPTADQVETTQTPEGPKDLTPVVVAVGPLEPHSLIGPEHVALRDFPPEMIPQADVTPNTTDVVGKEVMDEIFPGEMVILSRVQDPGEAQKKRFALQLQPGERAISISVDAVAASGGFISQGDIVDVIAVFPTSDQDQMVRIVLSNIRILAVGASFQRGVARGQGETIKGGPPRTNITLAVTPRMASKIQHLGSRTQFKLILKNPKDRSELETPGWTFSRLLRENLPPELTPAIDKVERKYLVSLFRGGTEEKVPVSLETTPEEEEDL